jgi:hypothetical protein
MVVTKVEPLFAENLESILDDSQTQAILEIFNKIGVNQWLAQNPFKKLALVEQSFIENAEVSGWYGYNTREAEISVIKNINQSGQQLDWGKVDKLSHTARTVLEAVQFTIIHELGHHVHNAYRQVNPLGFRQSMMAIRSNAVSNYAKLRDRPAEYFAETFVAWVLYRIELSVHDELGYAMIERALQALEIEVNEYDFNNR